MSWMAIAAGAIISILVLTWLIKVIKATVQTAIIIAALVFAMNFFGVGPGNLFQAAFDFALTTFLGTK